MKRVISFIVAFCMFMGTVGIVPVVAEDVASGTCGENLTWTLDKEGLLTISGEGDMETWSSNRNVPWYSYKKSIKSVVIEKGVTNIGENAFSSCSVLTSADIPEGVTRIENSAFYRCSSLASIEIPEGVTTIAYYAFNGCSGLVSVEIPEGVTIIGGSAFGGCSSLESVAIPDSLEKLSGGVFSGCISLKEIVVKESNSNFCMVDGVLFNAKKNTLYFYISGNEQTSYIIPNGVEVIENCAFEGCDNLTGVEIPEGVRNIGGSAFRGCSNLTSVVIPNGVRYIGGGAFSGCTGLTSVEIPDSVTAINDSVFSGCTGLTSIEIPKGITGIKNSLFSGCTGLTSIEIPEGVTEIGYSAFKGCTGLTSVVIPDGVTSIEHQAFSGCSSLTSVGLPKGLTSLSLALFNGCSSLTSVEIPEGVTAIGGSVFEGCSSLTSIEIPEGVTSIDYSAFEGCTGLTSIDIPDGVTSLGGSVFEGCSSLTSIEIPEGVTSIDYSAFEGCTGLTSVKIPEGVRNIGGSAFRGCSNLTSVVIPDGVTSIEGCVFEGCSSLASLVIPEGVTEIAYRAFAGCSGLTSVDIPVGVTEIGDYAFLECSSLVSVEIPGTITSIGSNAFNGCSSLKNIEIPNSVTSIENQAFVGCSSLESVVVPEGVTKISDYVFKECSSLRTVNIPDSVTEIGYSAFEGCSSLTSVIVPEGVTSIGRNAFLECSSLVSVEIPGTITSIGSNAFNGCSSLTSVEISEGVTTIVEGMFKGCSSLTNVDIPNSVTEIGGSAFNGCSSLTSIEIPEGVTSIDYSAFEGCTGLTSLFIPKGVKNICEYAFAECSGLKSVKIAKGKIAIDRYAFKGCSGLESVEISGDVTSIEGLAFRGCSSLRTVNIDGDVGTFGGFGDCDSLETVKIGGNVGTLSGLSDCDSLKSVKIGGNVGTLSGLSSCDSLESVNIEGKVVYIAGSPYIGSGAFSYSRNLKNVTIDGGVINIGEHAFYGCSSLVTAVFAKNANSIGDNAFEDCTSLTEIEINGDSVTVGSRAFEGCTGLTKVIIGMGVNGFGDCVFISCDNIADVYYYGSWDEWRDIDEYPHFNNATMHWNYKPATDRENNTNVNVRPPLSPEYVPAGINEVTINGQGTAFGRFLIYDSDGNVARNQRVVYVYDGRQRVYTSTNEHGYVMVGIPNVSKSGDYTVRITGSGIQDTEGIISVTVEPLHFKSGFEAVFELGSLVGVGPGAEAKIGNTGFEVKAATIGVGGNQKVGLTLMQEYANNKNKVVLSAQQNSSIVGTAKVGLFADADILDDLGVEIAALDVSGDVSAGYITGVGYEDSNFDVDDINDIKNMAKFLLAAMVSTKGVCDVLTKYIAEKIDAPVNYYESGTALTLKGGANAGVLDTAGAKVTLGGVDGKAMWTNGRKLFKDDSKEYRSSVAADGQQNFLQVDIGISDGAKTSIPTWRDSFIKGDLMLRAKETKDGDLEYVALDSLNTKEERFLVDRQIATDKRIITYEGEDAEKVVALYDKLENFSNGKKPFFTTDEFKKSMEAMFINDLTGKYSESRKISKGLGVDLSASFQLEVELSAKLAAMGLFSYEYEHEHGIVENGTVYVQGKNEIGHLVEKNALTLEKLMDALGDVMETILEAIMDEAEGWIESIGEELEEFGQTIVEFGEATLKTGKKTAKKWKVKIKTVIEDISLWSVLAVSDETALFSTSSVATTLGNPYIVEISDEDGNLVEDLSEQPLVLELKYTQEQLDNAQITDAESIRILRWDSDKCVYVNMGGEVDTEEMKVTLEITLPGQYILAVDNCEPAIVLFGQSHEGTNPTVSAYVSDMSGIEELSMTLDGEEIVGMENIEEHYDYTTGLLQYESGIEDGGEYTFTIYAKDTFGNETEQSYTAKVNDSEPTISDVTVVEEIIPQNKTITAKVSGEDVTTVLLNTLVATPFGDTYQLSVDMVEEDGVYKGTVPMLASGSVAEIWVSAYNHYGNGAASERQLTVIESEDEISIGILSVQGGIVKVKCTNADAEDKVYIAVYDADGAVVEVLSKNASDVVTFEGVKDGTLVKAFLWNGTDEMLPLSSSFVREIIYSQN